MGKPRARSGLCTSLCVLRSVFSAKSCCSWKRKAAQLFFWLHHHCSMVFGDQTPAPSACCAVSTGVAIPCSHAASVVRPRGCLPGMSCFPQVHGGSLLPFPSLFMNLLFFPVIPRFPRFIWVLLVAARLYGVREAPCRNVICWDRFGSHLVTQETGCGWWQRGVSQFLFLPLSFHQCPGLNPRGALKDVPAWVPSFRCVGAGEAPCRCCLKR